MNVLVTAAGRRTSLVRAFVTEARRRGGRVIAGDVDPLAPALFVADEAVRIPRTNDSGYVRGLLEIVEAHEVGLLVPTIDTDLPILAKHTHEFAAAGCRAVVSSPSFVAMTLDKETAGRAFERAGFRVPRSWPPETHPDTLPEWVFVKPRRGSASHNTFAADRSRLAAVLSLVPDPIVQELLPGPEITVDAFLDLAGRPVHYVPRRRIRTVGGESIQGVTLDHDPALEVWIVRVLEQASAWGAIGPLTLQAFLADDGPVLSEINPRFGGGFPLGLAAGAAYPAWLLDLAEGRPVPPRLGDYRPGLYMTRYYVEEITDRPKWADAPG